MEKRPETLNIFVYETFETEKVKFVLGEEKIKIILPDLIPSYIKLEHLMAEMYFARPPTWSILTKKNSLAIF